MRKFFFQYLSTVRVDLPCFLSFMADKKLYEVVKIEHFNSFSVRISGKHSIIMKILGDVIVAITAIARKGNENNIFDSKIQ